MNVLLSDLIFTSTGNAQNKYSKFNTKFAFQHPVEMTWSTHKMAFLTSIRISPSIRPSCHLPSYFLLQEVDKVSLPSLSRTPLWNFPWNASLLSEKKSISLKMKYFQKTAKIRRKISHFVLMSLSNFLKGWDVFFTF